jgi:hypothetical protein
VTLKEATYFESLKRKNVLMGSQELAKPH